jgi:hypothetical protein
MAVSPQTQCPQHNGKPHRREAFSIIQDRPAARSAIALQAGLQANRDAACGGRVSRRRPTGFPAVITRKINEARSSANDCGSDDPHYRAAFGFPVLPTPMNLNRENVLMQDLIII